MSNNEKVKAVTKELSCFIIMPFVEAKINDDECLDQEELDYLYEEYYIKALNSFEGKNGEKIKASRQNDTAGNFTKQIIEKLSSSDIVLAEMTGNNPNVMYELGIRHSVKLGTIMMTQNIDQIPSDLKSYIAIQYNYGGKPKEQNKNYKDFKAKLHQTLNEMIEQNFKTFDNPVSDFLQVETLVKDKQKIDQLETLLILAKENKRVFDSYLFNTADQFKDGFKKVLTYQINFQLDLLMHKIIENKTLAQDWFNKLSGQKVAYSCFEINGRDAMDYVEQGTTDQMSLNCWIIYNISDNSKMSLTEFYQNTQYWDSGDFVKADLGGFNYLINDIQKQINKLKDSN